MSADPVMARHYAEQQGAEYERFERIETLLARVAELLIAQWPNEYAHEYGATVLQQKIEAVIGSDPFRPKPRQGRREIPASIRRQIFERDGYRCVRCKGWIKLSIDHKIPLSKGGTDDPANLQTMCKSCNSAKGNRLEVAG